MKTTNSHNLSLVLNAKPARQTAFIYQAIILSLAAHIFVLAVTYLLSGVGEGQQTDTTAENQLTEINLSFIEEEPVATLTDMPENMSEDVRNLLANASSQTTKEKVNFRSKSKAEIEAEVLQNLKGIEQDEFEKLKTSHKDFSVDEQNDQQGKEAKNSSKETFDHVFNQSDKSYEGKVSANYDLKERTAKSSPRPIYRCKSPGVVVIKIEVDQTGVVTSSSIDENKSVNNDCLREESQKYALRWKFDAKATAPKKQSGTITFTFSAQ